METIEIKRAAPSDVALLQEIGRQTFFETFAAGNSEENMQKYLQEGFSTKKMALSRLTGTSLNWATRSRPTS